jgi:hypothetical protein
MIEILLAYIKAHIWELLGFAGFGAMLSYILKKIIPDNWIITVSNAVEKFGFGIGVAVTLGLAKWRWTKGIWNNVIEPYVIVLLRVVFLNLSKGIIRGLQSDNE